jgi:hypothetical protein
VKVYDMDRADSMAGESYAPTPVLSGELAVTVNVHIVFLFE